MARIHHVKQAQQRYAMVPVIDPATGLPKITAVTREDGSPKLTRRGKPITRAVTVVDRTKPKPNLRCDKCGTEIKVGDPYKWVKVKSGPYGGRTMVRCATCPTWKQSEMSSSNMAGVYAAQEQADEEVGNCETVEDLQSLAQSVAEQIREVAQLYRDSAENMESGFGHATSMSDELNDKADQLESWADDIEQLDFVQFDEDDVELDGVEPDDREQTIEDAREEWLEEQRDKLTEEAGNCPV